MRQIILIIPRRNKQCGKNTDQITAVNLCRIVFLQKQSCRSNNSTNTYACQQSHSEINFKINEKSQDKSRNGTHCQHMQTYFVEKIK